MKTLKKVLAVVLAMVMVLGLAACGKAKRPETYARMDDEEVYKQALGGYADLMAAAKAAETNDERFVLYAQAEAYLLDSAVFIPTTTQGGRYTISRVAPRTIPYVQWGNDDDRLKGVVISDEFLTKEERAELLDQWAAAVKGEGTYDPAAYLTGKGHTIVKDYRTTFQTAPVTLDTLNTSSQSDTEILVNTTDNLVQYNNLGQMVPAMAESWEVSEDGLTYTFHIRQGAYWYTTEGQQYAECKADDFVAGMQHMLDAEAGLEWLIASDDLENVDKEIIKGVTNYLYLGGSFDDVGYKAVDDYTLEITLAHPTSYFLTMLTYSCFSPICREFYVANGGVFGRTEYAEASAAGSIRYGNATDVASQVYNGAFLLQQLEDNSVIKVVKNPNYYDAENVVLDSITWVFDNGENPTQLYADVQAGNYPGCSLLEGNGTLALAKADGSFDKYAYISDTTSTTYFGALNLNRGTYALESGACASPKTEDQKIDTQLALLNKNFRKAFLHAFDRATYNAVINGEDLKTSNLRNMYTHPEFVQLSEAVTDKDGTTFPAGTMYGELVQHYVSKLDENITVKDGIDGWYAPEAAKAYLEAAKKELGKTVNWPVTIDIVYYSPNANQTAQAEATKKVIEDCLGADNVVVNLIEATVPADYYAVGYRAADGEAEGMDFFYGSGWGPDFGDPCTYLDTFLGDGAGYMTKTIGLF